MTRILTRPATATAVATVAGHTTQFVPVHREGITDPVVFTATVSLPLSFEDLVAALWTVTGGLGGLPAEEIDPDPAGECGVVRLVLETVVSNPFGMRDAREQFADFQPGSVEHDVLTQVRALVAAAFGDGRGEVV